MVILDGLSLEVADGLLSRSVPNYPLQPDSFTEQFDQVTNFLNLMAKEIDHDTPAVVQDPENVPGHIANHPGPGKDLDTAPKPSYNPVRRKLGLNLFPSN